MIGDTLKKQKRTITIAGTVGIGKSTLTKSLAHALSYQTSFEKVEGNPYLQSFYQDLKSWSFHLQIYFLSQRYQEQMKISQSKESYIQDRSIYEDVDIFANMLLEQGNITKIDYETYTDLFQQLVYTEHFPKPDVLVYVDGPFDKIMERLKSRGREMEQQTSLEYWKDLHQRYQKWIENFSICPVVKLNMEDYDLIHNPESIYFIIEEIEKKL